MSPVHFFTIAALPGSFNQSQLAVSTFFLKCCHATSFYFFRVKFEHLYSTENNWTSLTFTRSRVVLTQNHYFKITVNLPESKLYYKVTQFWTINPNLHSLLSTKINRYFQNGVAIGKKVLYFCFSQRMFQPLVDCGKFLNKLILNKDNG